MSTLYEVISSYENLELDVRVYTNLYNLYTNNILDKVDDYIINTIQKMSLIKDRKKRSREINKYVKEYINKLIINSTYFNIYLSGLPTEGKGHLENEDGSIIENQILPVDKESVYDTFEKFGEIVSLVDVGYGKFIIKYKNSDDALRAKEYVDHHLIGDKKVRVRYLYKSSQDNNSDIECDEEYDKYFNNMIYSFIVILLFISLYFGYNYPTNFLELCSY
jgi:hypothetical protein